MRASRLDKNFARPHLPASTHRLSVPSCRCHDHHVPPTVSSSTSICHLDSRSSRLYASFGWIGFALHAFHTRPAVRRSESPAHSQRPESFAVCIVHWAQWRSSLKKHRLAGTVVGVAVYSPCMPKATSLANVIVALSKTGGWQSGINCILLAMPTNTGDPTCNTRHRVRSH